VKAVLLHQHRHGRRRHHCKVVAHLALPAFLHVELAPLLDLGDHHGVHQPDPRSRRPSTLRRVAQRLPGGIPHGACRPTGPVAEVAARRHPGQPCPVTGDAVTLEQFGRRLTAEQAVPQRLPAPSVARDRADADDVGGCLCHAALISRVRAPGWASLPLINRPSVDIDQPGECISRHLWRPGRCYVDELSDTIARGMV
jgi:hypothetical protein